MPTESDLRDLLRDPDPGSGGIDVDAVLRRARARRRPRVVAAAAVGSLALVGVLVPATLPLLSGGDSPAVMVADEAAGGDAVDTDAAAPESSTGETELAPGPTVEYSDAPAPWRIDIADPVGDLAACGDDPAVAASLTSADQPATGASLTLVDDATPEDVVRVVGCLERSLSGGAITVFGPN